MSEELKPCPFCDDPMVLAFGETLQHEHKTDCPIGQMAWGGRHAVERWNRRARPSPTVEKVEAEPVAGWRNEITHPNSRLLFRRMMEKASVIAEEDDITTALVKVAALPTVATLAAAERERDEARLNVNHWRALYETTLRVCQERGASLAAANARIAGLEEGFRIATDALDGLSYIHDGNPSDAMADVPPVEYARHMLYEARMAAREAAANARAALTVGKVVPVPAAAPKSRVKALDEDDYRSIQASARSAKREFFRGYAPCDIPIQDDFGWWVMKETEARILAALEDQS